MPDKGQRHTDAPKSWWRQWLKEILGGITGNAFYDILKWIGKGVMALVWVAVGHRLVSSVQRLLGNTLPVLQNFLSTEVISTEVVVTLGTITAIVIPLLVLLVVWWVLAQKRRLKED